MGQFDFSGISDLRRGGSKTTVFETRLERSELVEPARGIIRVTNETSNPKRKRIVE
jgi:hypothetical protein